MSVSEMHDMDRKLMEIAVEAERGLLHEDENHAAMNCPECGREHLGQLFMSPPDGYYVRAYCLKTGKRLRRSFA